MADIPFFVRIALDGNRIDLAQPAAQVDLPATLGAEGHRLAGGGIELLLADRAANERHGWLPNHLWSFFPLAGLPPAGLSLAGFSAAAGLASLVLFVSALLSLALPDESAAGLSAAADL